MCRVERLAQQRAHKYPLGQRLWRIVGAGGNKYYDDKDDKKKGKEDRMVKLFFSYSLELGDHIRTGLVKIGQDQRVIAMMLFATLIWILSLN